MKVLKTHHVYELENFEKKDEPGQIIKFIEKAPKEEGSIEMVTIDDGTTNEELAKVLIHRIKGLNEKFPCRENAIALTNFETGLMWLEKRTRDRVERGVEGKATV